MTPTFFQVMEALILYTIQETGVKKNRTYDHNIFRVVPVNRARSSLPGL